MGWLIDSVSIALIVIMAFLTTKYVYEKRKVRAYFQRLEESRNSLEDLFDEGEKMIQELNRFSEYIVARIDVKNAEIWSSIKKLDEKVDESERRIRIIKVEADRMQSDLKAALVRGKVGPGAGINEGRVKKVIPINSRYRDVLKLAANGYSDTEIAKKLGMGKGEIKLVLDLCK